MKKFNNKLDEVIKENSDKLKFTGKGITSGLPKTSWLDSYQYGGDIFLPNVYPNQMVPKFKEGGDRGKKKKKSAQQPTPQPQPFTFNMPSFTGPTRSDSAFLVQNNRIIQKYLDTQKYKVEDKEKIDPKKWPEKFKKAKTFYEKGIEAEVKAGSKKKKPKEYKKTKGKLIGTSDWVAGGGEDYGVPFQYIHPDIAPQYQGDLRSPDPANNPWIFSYGYDELAITPWDMLDAKQQKERLKKYGTTGTPYDKKTKTITAQKSTGVSQDVTLPPTVEEVPTSQVVNVQQPVGYPVYGPSRSLIGNVTSSGQFTPASYQGMNKGDTNLLNNQEQLSQYLRSQGINNPLIKQQYGGGAGPYPKFPSTGMLTSVGAGPKVPTMKKGGQTTWVDKYKF